jgi:cell division protein FtsB
MKWLTLALAGALVLIQYPLWLGKGGWLRVWEVDQQIGAQRSVNARLKARNDALDAEVRDLKQGFEAIEERARSELGMVRQDEVFFQILEPSRAPQNSIATSERAVRP